MRKYKDSIKLGRKIRRIRKLQKLSQEDLAAKIGVHPTTLGRIERGESNAPVHTISKVARALKTRLHELFR